MKAKLILTPSNILTIIITGLDWDSTNDISLISRTLELAYGYHLHGQLEYDESTSKHLIKFHRWASDKETMEIAKNALMSIELDIEE